jgi:hypothetical protein
MCVDVEGPVRAVESAVLRAHQIGRGGLQVDLWARHVQFEGRRSVVIDFRGFLPGVRTSHTRGYIDFSRASFHGYIVARSTFAIHKAVADRDATENWKYP